MEKVIQWYRCDPQSQALRNQNVGLDESIQVQPVSGSLTDYQFIT